VYREEMIAAAEPTEFIPCGRKKIEEHPGSLNKKSDVISNEFILLDRMRNVNLCAEENHNESWTLREVYDNIKSNYVDQEFEFLSPSTVNSEEELYFSGNTAVWIYGKDRNKASSEICYTTETPIQFAFFCTENFLNPQFKISEIEKSKNKTNKNYNGIAIIDSNSLKVYSRDGENLITSIEPPIRKIWSTKYCIIIEKDASSALIDGHSLPMPRYFSLNHALDDMYPILIKIQALVTYIAEDEYKVNLIK
jgi:anaphase-promoting complex subunit 1